MKYAVGIWIIATLLFSGCHSGTVTTHDDPDGDSDGKRLEDGDGSIPDGDTENDLENDAEDGDTIELDGYIDSDGDSENAEDGNDVPEWETCPPDEEYAAPHSCEDMQGTCPDDQVCLIFSDDISWCLEWNLNAGSYGWNPPLDNPTKEDYPEPPEGYSGLGSGGIWLMACTNDLWECEDGDVCCDDTTELYYPEGYTWGNPAKGYIYQCDAEHELHLLPTNGWCIIGYSTTPYRPDYVVRDLEANPDNYCEVCDVTISQTEWTPRTEGVGCGQGMVCDGEGNCVEQ